MADRQNVAQGSFPAARTAAAAAALLPVIMVAMERKVMVCLLCNVIHSRAREQVFYFAVPMACEPN